jgi:hypothetical protein
MSVPRRYWRWIVGVVALLCAYWIYNYLSVPLTITDAVSDGKVDAQIIASGDSGSSATITLTRPSGVSGTITILIPSGTVLYGGNSGVQRLITAVPVTLVLADGSPSLSQEIPTFCIDEFAAPPQNNVVLSFDPLNDGRRVTTEETEKFHKLADCMAGWSQSDSDKQLAVWAVESDWLHKTRSEALSFLIDHYVEQMTDERRDQLNEKKPEIVSMAPMLTSERIDELIDTELDNGMPELRDIATNKASQQLDLFISHDKESLSSCGYAATDMPLFQ